MSSNSLWSASDENRRELQLSAELAFFTKSVGGFVAGGLYLFGGAPAAGKSLLAMQIALDLAAQNHRSLFILTEQNAAAMKTRAVQMLSDRQPGKAQAALDRVDVEENICEMASLPTYIAPEVLSTAGRYHGTELVVLDSIQGSGISSAATKIYGSVLESSRLCTDNDIAVILISHITKKGEVAGPKTLEHGVDVTLMLRRAMLYNLMGVRKNRFGPPVPRLLPLTIDRKTLRMGPAPHANAQPGAARTYSQSGGPMQVQASVTVPPDGRQARMTAPGLPKKEIEQLIECVGQIDGLDLSDLDYRIQCRLPRGGQYLTYFGLPLCMALIASYARKPLPETSLYLGEIDLFRQVLDVPIDVLQALVAAIDNGEISAPVNLFVPASAVPHLPRGNVAVKVIPCRRLEDAIYNTWPELRPQGK